MQTALKYLTTLAVIAVFLVLLAGLCLWCTIFVVR